MKIKTKEVDMKYQTNIDSVALQIDFEKEVPKVKLQKIGKVIEYDGYKVVLAVERKNHAKAAAEILTKFEVDNLDIQEIKLEDVILKHFSK